MSDAIKSDMIWRASVKGFRAEIAARRDKVTKSLTALQNKDGLYASEHRKLVRMFADVLDVIDRHGKDMPEPPNPFTTPLDDPRMQKMIAETETVWDRPKR